MIKMIASSEILARSEDRNLLQCDSARLSGLVWNGQSPSQGSRTYFTPASPLKRVFYWARFHLTAKMRSRVRYPRVDVCLNCKQVKLLIAALARKYRVIGETVVQGCSLVSSDISVGPTCLSRKTSTDKGSKQRQAITESWIGHPNLALAQCGQ